ncbi:hypothetical protein PFICI_09324 [Pestalotiopsis fici W106-1]|uniref:Uncharacterized protein n=1 Tax=Pestalotiopsis fici (strain W106-1 / CGMCC3.15140) TaxID=1229662 RepID=W3X2U4_PESFW|nr:uncharacterized protein PFICI_09324 [Pestalotiopsis fici W106-1]ETS79471.1 hypothetical protein PFICI_09324 [Pestalotiopsis fici W106-1]
MAAEMTQEQEPGVQVITVTNDEGTGEGPPLVTQDGGTPESEARRLESAPCYIISGTTEAAVAQIAASPESLQQQLGEEMTILGAASKRLVVVHGLPTGFTPLLSTELGIDPDLIRAVAGRKRYRPKLIPAGSCPASVVSYEYPLLLGSDGTRAVYEGNGDYDEIYGQTRDEMTPPLVCPMASSSSDNVAFCRVTAWQSDTNNVLFLDRPSWLGTSSSPDGDSLSEMDTLERQAWQCVSSEESMNNFTSTIETMVHEHWVEFMDALQPGMDKSSEGTMSLAWEIQRRLEANLHASLSSSSSSSGGSVPGLQAYSAVRPNWQALLDRGERHRRLAFDIASLKSRIERTVIWPPETIEKPRQPGGNATPWYPDEVKQESLQTEENQRSLDRVSYLGGVLLPVSIVSGILSMGDTFGPGGDLFYVFWAAGVPLTVLTLLVIYADSIRREVVYVQTSHRGGDSSSDSSSHQVAGDGSGEEGWRWNRMGNEEQVTVSMPDLESAFPPTVPYTEQIPISEPISAVPAASPYPRLDKANSVASEPVAMLEPRFGKKKPHDKATWERRELGWMGAAMCALRLSELKRQQRPPRAVGRSESRFTTTPRL